MVGAPTVGPAGNYAEFVSVPPPHADKTTAEEEEPQIRRSSTGQGGLTHTNASLVYPRRFRNPNSTLLVENGFDLISIERNQAVFQHTAPDQPTNVFVNYFDRSFTKFETR